MTKDEFVIRFGVLSEYFGAQPSKGLSMLYFNAFESWPLEKFEQACDVLVKTRTYSGLPKIAEFIEALEGKQEDRTEIAYQTLMETLRNHAFWDTVIFEDGAIGHAVEDMGGWQRISEWTLEDWKFRRKEFEQLYHAHLKRGNNEPVRLSGYFEQDNAGKGLLNYVPEPKLIEDKARVLAPGVKKIAVS